MNFAASAFAGCAFASLEFYGGGTAGQAMTVSIQDTLEGKAVLSMAKGEATLNKEPF